MSDGQQTHRTFHEPGTGAAQRAARSAQLELVARAAIAARELCDVLWEALRAQLELAPGQSADSRADPGAGAAQEAVRMERSAELAARLVDVAGTVALLARADAPEGLAAAELPTQDDAVSEPFTGPPAPARPPAPAPLEPVRAHASARAASERVRAPSQAEPRSEPALGNPGPARAAVLTDERDAMLPAAELGAQARAPWIELIDRALARFEHDRLPFAVLLLEASGFEQPPPGTIHEDLSPQTRAVERSLAEALEPMGGRSAASPLALEAPGRYWVLVPGCDRLDARELVGRLLAASAPEDPDDGADADAAERYFAALSQHTSPLRARRMMARGQLSVGTAVCPQNGQDAAALATHANIELAALRAASLPSAPAAEPA